MIALALTLERFASPLVLAELHPGRWPSLWVVTSLGYLGAGAAMAWHLARRGHGLGTATSALLCWPLLTSLIGRPPPREPLDLRDPDLLARGPNGARIHACVTALSESLREDFGDEAGALIEPAQLTSLAAALTRADLRIARVDRLLRGAEAERQRVEAGSARLELDGAVATLTRARDHAQAELEGVLSGLVSLRLQLGLFALAGEGEPVRERLRSLEARVAALAELSSIDLGQVPT